MPELYIPPFSYDNYLTYKIKDGDIPQSVANQLGIDLYLMRSYHNRYCPLEDCIGPVFPRHLKFVIIQSEEDKKIKEAYREPIHFSSPDFKLPFRPNQLNKNYLAEYTVFNGNEMYSIKEEIHVKWLATDNDYSCIQIDRKALYINNNEKKSMADELAEITAKVFYPLKLVVNSDGKFVDIYNFDDIRNRWQKVKKEVLKEFRGVAVEERLKVFESKLDDNIVILKSFLNDWFLRAFFNGLNIEYKQTLTVENTIRFPISKKIGEVEFLVKQTILPTVDQYNLVNVTQTGTLSDSRSKDDFENNLLFPYTNTEEKEVQKLEGNFEAYYFLNPNTNVVDSLYLECEIKLDIPQKIAIAISSFKDQGKLMIDSGISLYVPAEKKKQDLELFWMKVTVIVVIIVGVYGVYKFYFEK